MLAGPNDRSDVEKGGKSKDLKKTSILLPCSWEFVLIKGPFTIHVLVV